MPEGDSVHRLANRLQPLVGRRITRSQFRVPQLATATLTGTTIARVWAHGKHLYWECQPDVGEALILHTHLRMEGTWAVHKTGDRWSKPGHTARVVVEVTGGVELVGHELGVVELWPAAQYPERTTHLGPDVLASDWSGRGRDEAIARISADPARTIGEALLDQRNLAGIGNEYRAEVCFLAGLHPAARVGDVDVPTVVDLAAKLMQANLASPVRTFTGDHRRGETTFVFGRNHRPCRRCCTTILQDRLGGATSVTSAEAGRERIIWWCPTCQPLEPAVPRSSEGAEAGRLARRLAWRGKQGGRG